VEEDRAGRTCEVPFGKQIEVRESNAAGVCGDAGMEDQGRTAAF